VYACSRTPTAAIVDSQPLWAPTPPTVSRLPAHLQPPLLPHRGGRRATHHPRNNPAGQYT